MKSYMSRTILVPMPTWGTDHGQPGGPRRGTSTYSSINLLCFTDFPDPEDGCNGVY